MNKELEYFEEADIVEPGRQHEFIGKLNELVDFVNKENEEKTCYCGNCDDMFGISHFTAGTCNKRFALNEEPQDTDLVEHAGDWHYKNCLFPTTDSAVCECPRNLKPSKSQPAPSETLIDEPVTKKEITPFDVRIGMLRQWINERPKGSKLLTNDDIKYWLDIK